MKKYVNIFFVLTLLLFNIFILSQDSTLHAQLPFDGSWHTGIAYDEEGNQYGYWGWCIKDPINPICNSTTEPLIKSTPFK